VIAGHLATAPLLSASIERQPGLRVPGAFDAFEIAVRAVLGQQVSVRGASTLAGRLAERFGETIATPLPCLSRIAPTPEALAAVPSTTLATIGLPNARAESLHHLASAVAMHALELDAGVDPSRAIVKLTELPGIGPWTAEYIAMRALRWPDAFPSGDLGLRKATQSKSAKELERAAEAWRPWRAYAAMHLWQSLTTPTN
jgi:AraC family transcriptional regulator of adaptative response / DNA-3-methyladenine glycosylase II